MDCISTLNVAIHHRDLKAVQRLINLGVDVNEKKAANGITPLHQASAAGSREIVTLLISSGARVNERDNDGETPLFHAVAKDGDAEVVRALIEGGAEVGCTLLCRALFMPIKREANARVMKEENASTNVRVRKKDVKIARLLVQAGADVNAVDAEGRRPLHVAAILPSEEIFAVLIEAGAGASINERDGMGNTPLHFGVSLRNKKIVRLLLENGADGNLKNNEGCSPFEIACGNYYNLAKEGDVPIGPQEVPISVEGDEPIELKILNLFFYHFNKGKNEQAGPAPKKTDLRKRVHRLTLAAFGANSFSSPVGLLNIPSLVLQQLVFSSSKKKVCSGSR